MTQPIDRETVIALADLWDSQWPTYPRTPEGIGGMVAVKLCAKELREAVAHLRKDAEPVAWLYEDLHGQFVSLRPPSDYSVNELSENEVSFQKLYTHPPEADKLLQQALEALDNAGNKRCEASD